MNNNIFCEEFITEKKEILINPGRFEVEGVIFASTDDKKKFKGDMFAQEIFNSYVTDFEKSKKACFLGKADKVDSMVHVSTFIYIDDFIYMTYYANTHTDKEDPLYQVARLCYCPADDVDNKTFLDVQSVGEICGGKKVDRVYDTILMQKDEKTLYVLWTASLDEKYYRLYREFDVETKTFGEVHINRFKVGDIVNDFSTSGMVNALYENEIGVKQMYSDIGIMQKLSSRMENGEKYYYTGAYSGDFNCIIKSKDFITWEYVSQPDFPNYSKWENAVYVHEDKCYYFVRQHDEIKYGFLTCYDLKEKRWEKPVFVEDCQSRSDFIMYNGELYLFYAPVNREHIGVLRINTEELVKSEVLFVADMHTSCFYPFVQYNNKNTLSMSYTVDRKHIRLAEFDFEKYTV